MTVFEELGLTKGACQVVGLLRSGSQELVAQYFHLSLVMTNKVGIAVYRALLRMARRWETEHGGFVDLRMPMVPDAWNRHYTAWTKSGVGADYASLLCTTLADKLGIGGALACTSKFSSSTKGLLSLCLMSEMRELQGFVRYKQLNKR